MDYQSYVATFKALKEDGVEAQDAMDMLEFDSDEYPDPKELQAAFEEVYGSREVLWK